MTSINNHNNKITNILFDDDDDDNNKEDEISMLSWNLFTFYGRYWTRMELIKLIIKKLNPEILCLQEAICTNWWNFGTFNIIKQVFNDKCNSSSFNLQNHLSNEYKLIFENCFIWYYFIGELQCFLNVYFLIPTFGKKFFEIGFKGKEYMKALMAAFCGLPLHFGKLIIFRNNKKLYYEDSLILPGFCDAIRTLYLTKNNRKIWIVNTHLTASAQSSYNNNKLQVNMLIKWMNDKLCKKINADLIIIAGDFNSIPSSNVYKIMKQNGYKSCLCDKLGVNKYFTYTSVTWTYSSESDDDYGKNLCLDYIWIKNENKNNQIVIKQCKLIGNNYFTQTIHANKNVKIYASDHFGIFLQITINKRK